MVEQSKWLSRLVIATGIMMLCGLWLLVWNQVAYERKNELENAAVATGNLSKAFEEQVQSVLADANNDMRIIQRAYEREGPSSPVIAAILEQIRSDSSKFQGGITNHTGIFVASSASQALTLDYGDREWFRHLRGNGVDDLFIGAAETSKMSGKSVIPMSRRLRHADGSFAGVVHISLSLDHFETAIKKLELGSGGVISINRMDGVNLLRKTRDSQGSGWDVRNGEVWKNAQLQSAGTLISPGAVDGVQRLFAYRVMPDYPLQIVVGSATEMVLAPFEQRKKKYILGAFAASFFIIGFCYLLIDRMRKQKAELLLLRRNAEIQTQANETLERRVEERTQEIEAANEELTAQNEEIAAMNEEIGALNQNLMEVNDTLEVRVAERTTDLLATQQELTAQIEELDKTQRVLSASEDRLNRAQSIAHVGNWEIEIGSGQTWVSAEVPKIFGLEQDAASYIPFETVRGRVCPEDLSRVDQAGKALLERGESYDLEFKIHHAVTGQMRIMHSIAEVERNQAGEPIKVIGVIQDVTELKLVADALAENEARYRAVVEQAPEAVILCDLDTGEILEANSRFAELTGYDLQQHGQLSLFELIADTSANIRDAVAWLRLTGKLPMQRRKMHHSNAGILDVERSATVVRYRGYQLAVMTIRDVSEELRRADEDHFFATHDELTGLYNRRGFAERIAVFLETETDGTLLLLDIDDFKIVSDANGQNVGDQCLAALAAYLRENFDETAVIARFVGDEFALFFAGPVGLTEARRAYDSLKGIGLKTSRGSFFIQLSGGISLFSEQEPELDMHVQRAYLAMHHAKESGKWCCKQYEPALQEHVGRRYAIKTALNNALSNDEFYLVFQPIFDIRRFGQFVAGYEVLLRWKSPHLGVVSPVEFIQVAEETNLILPIGEWVLREACLFSVKLRQMQGDFINIAVNISMLQLALPNFVDMVKKTLQETGLPASNLHLEVTESILMTDAETRIGYLQELRDIGIGISLDDFGTGYSSFTYLTQLPITTLKIDKSMVDGIMTESERKKSVLESLIQMSAVLGYEVVAEGVETEEQLAFLRKKGCDYCQGFLLSRPLSESAVIARLLDASDDTTAG